MFQLLPLFFEYICWQWHFFVRGNCGNVPTCVKFISSNKVHLSRINWTLTKLSLEVAANVCAIRWVSAATERYENLMFQYWAISRGRSEILSQFIFPTFSRTSRKLFCLRTPFWRDVRKSEQGMKYFFTNVRWRRRRRRELSAFPFTNFGDFTSQLKLSHLLVLCVATIKTTQQKLPRKLSRVSRQKRKTRIYMEKFLRWGRMKVRITETVTTVDTTEMKTASTVAIPAVSQFHIVKSLKRQQCASSDLQWFYYAFCAWRKKNQKRRKCLCKVSVWKLYENNSKAQQARKASHRDTRQLRGLSQLLHTQ